MNMMSDDMNLSVNGHSKVPPGFRFHPTEEELLHYYLRKKLASHKIDLDVIRDVDLNKLEPWDIQEICKIGSTPQNDWYFFSHKDKKYPTGTRTNRATAAGFWKATGRDKVIYSNMRRIGMRKTLVFYRGRAPHGQKSDWIMHEYRLDDNTTTHDSIGSSTGGGSESTAEEGWVVCRVFKKKNYHKAASDIPSINLPRNDAVLDQILMYMGRTSSCCSKQDKDFTNAFLHLPELEPVNPSVAESPSPTDWATLDRLVASQLSGLHPNSEEDSFSFSIFDHHHQEVQPHRAPSLQNVVQQDVSCDLWNFAPSSSSLSLSSSSSDPLCHLSV